MTKPKMIPAIVGPTGVGKTAYALSLAPKINAEIISADSRQVFISMDIATGKESNHGHWTIINNRRTLIIGSVPIHALDLATPDQEFNIRQWHDVAVQLIDEIIQRGHQPLIVGGTGFYLDALMGHVQTMSIPPNADLRIELQRLSRAELQKRLQSLDPERWQSMNYSDQQNPARLMRAIEIETARGKTNQQTNKPTNQSAILLTSYSLLLIGLTMPRQQLYSKIDTRLDRMLDQGLAEETKQLIKQYGRHHQSMTGLGYAEVADYLDGQTSLPTAMQKFKNRAHAYARRQYTWFNHRPVHWFDTTHPNWQKQADSLIQATIHSGKPSL